MNDEKMRKEQFSRTERLLGRENMERLSAARVAVFGIGHNAVVQRFAHAVQALELVLTRLKLGPCQVEDGRQRVGGAAHRGPLGAA